ncbi:MAG: hypothetical protein ABA06_00515 [Parcubacteria bacterium C7867-001]|nr:MAG: hypothetical protein ABA06_00515 [Parcubacteria bacterium C7867-001]
MRPSFVRAFLSLLAIASGGCAALLPTWLSFEASSTSQFGGLLCALIGGMCLVSTILQSERRAEH